MPRKARKASGTGYYHVIVRGNNKQRVFHQKVDLIEYLNQIGKYCERNEIVVHHYCVMNNHVHMLLRAKELRLLGNFMHGVQRGYHHYYRKKYTLFGHLFQGRYKSLAIEDEKYLLECGRYIERNPVAAKIVARPEEWKYSSYIKYVGGKGADWLELFLAYLGLAQNEADRRELYKQHVEISRPYDEALDKQIWTD